MGISKQQQMEYYENNQKEFNLDKNGEYISCTDCGKKLGYNEKWDDNCMSCKLEQAD